MNKIRVLLNPEVSAPKSAIDRLYSARIAEQVNKFHNSIPGFTATPLIKLNALASALGVGQIFVKDESQRLQLNAFKVLGASFAIARQLSQVLNIDEPEISYQQIIERKLEYQHIKFATATDGNHGRAVAWCSRLFGCNSYIYMPQGTTAARFDAIDRFANYAKITDSSYDDTVRLVRQQARQNNWLLVQDTAWQGYQEIPDDIMRGYFTLLYEFEIQCGDQWPTHVFLQAGVGSMAAALAVYLAAHPNPTPKIILVEPTGASCFYDSIQIGDGNPHRFNGELDTIMAGLACGEPSPSAWKILSATCSAFIACDDQVSISGMRRCASPIGLDPAIISGESGAVTLGLVEMLVGEPEYSSICSALEINDESEILLLSTEGDTDPEFYQQTVNLGG